MILKLIELSLFLIFLIFHAPVLYMWKIAVDRLGERDGEGFIVVTLASLVFTLFLVVGWGLILTY